MPISSGSQPATTNCRNVPSGSIPRRSASSPRMTTQAAAPSDSWLALPAVTVPPSVTGGSDGEPLGRRPRPVAFVGAQRHRLEMRLAGVAIDDATLGR